MRHGRDLSVVVVVVVVVVYIFFSFEELYGL